MTKVEIRKGLKELNIPDNYYSLGYEIKNNAINIHTLPNGKYSIFSLDERGEKYVIKTDIESEEMAFYELYNIIKKDREDGFI